MESSPFHVQVHYQFHSGEEWIIQFECLLNLFDLRASEIAPVAVFSVDSETILPEGDKEVAADFLKEHIPPTALEKLTEQAQLIATEKFSGLRI